jgi:hypothetical protein
MTQQLLRSLPALALMAACFAAASAQAPPQPQPNPPIPGGPMPLVPELGKKLNQIMVLREMVPLRLTVEDLTTALPALKKLRDSEKALQATVDKLLEQEKKALLLATPDDPPRVEIGQLLQHESAGFRREQQETWAKLTDAIGGQKAGGLRRLCAGAEGMGPGDRGVPAPGGRPANRPPTNPGDAGEPGMLPPLVEPQGEGFGPVGPPEIPQKGEPIPPRAQIGATRPGMPGAMQPFLPPRVSLAELVELLEMKLAALKK